jgi:Cu(I)/Ag(I) efflux system membrane fusion protein
MQWMKQLEALRQAVQAARDAGELPAIRAAFEGLSQALEPAVERFGPKDGKTLYKVRCPMAFGGRGAVWLQADRDVRNPYYGASMLKCGNVVETIDRTETDGPQK